MSSDNNNNNNNNNDPKSWDLTTTVRLFFLSFISFHFLPKPSFFDSLSLSLFVLLLLLLLLLSDADRLFLSFSACL